MNLEKNQMPKKNPIIQKIDEHIDIYKEKAAAVTAMLREVEAYRNRIVNEIEEAEYQDKINKRQANRLEDKLTRPYSFDLLR